MVSKKITCPKCKGVLEVRNPSNAPSLLITCPNQGCGAKLRLHFETGETQIADEGKEEIGYLYANKTKHELKEGINIIGRRADDSNATVQIDTDDLSMSRMHAEITVVRLKSGRTKAIIRDMRDEEKQKLMPTIVDEEPLLAEDRIVLGNGDIIRMGQTKAKYLRK